VTYINVTANYQILTATQLIKLQTPTSNGGKPRPLCAIHPSPVHSSLRTHFCQACPLLP